MGFLKIIMGFLSKLASKGQALMRWLWSKAQDSETGKIKGVNPKKIPKIFTTVAVVTALILLIIHLTKPDMKINTGLATFEKETAPSSSADYRFEQNGIDPNIDKIPISTGISDVPQSLVDGVQTSEVLSVSDCLEVIEKMKTSVKLTESEVDLANRCIAENPMGLTPDEILLANKLLDPNTTQAERDFLAKALRGELTPEERNLALALAGNDPEKAALARQAINSGDPELIRLAAKSVSGKELTDEEKEKLASLTSAGTQSESAKLDSTLDGGQSGSANQGSRTGVTNEDVEKLSLDVVAGDKNIADKIKEIERAKREAQDVADKIKQGSDLGDSEVRRLQNLTTKQKELDALKKQQEANKKSLADKMAKLKETIQRSMVTVGGKNIPTGVFVEYEGEDQCSNKVKPFTVKKPVKPKLNYVDLDNRPLNPEEVEFIKLMRKGGDKKEVSDKSVDFISKLGEPMQLVANGDTATNIEQMIVFSDKGLKDCELTADMMIPAQLDSEILISSGGGSQQVRMKILMDVYCPTSAQQLLIPKGAIAIAQSGGFDADTGIMTMNIDKVTAGGKNMSFRFNVASANGASGLRGEVRDTTGKYLIGAFIPAFAGAALSYFSQQTVQPFLQSTNAQQAITGAALAGSAEVMNKIAELAASKMLNAPKIFWVPKGIPVVLIPQ